LAKPDRGERKPDGVQMGPHPGGGSTTRKGLFGKKWRNKGPDRTIVDAAEKAR